MNLKTQNGEFSQVIFSSNNFFKHLMNIYMCFLRPSSLSSLPTAVPDIGLLRSELEQLDETLDKLKEDSNKAQVNVLILNFILK